MLFCHDHALYEYQDPPEYIPDNPKSGSETAYYMLSDIEQYLKATFHLSAPERDPLAVP